MGKFIGVGFENFFPAGGGAFFVFFSVTGKGGEIPWLAGGS